MAAVCEAVKNYGPLAGRIMLGVIFVISGWGKIGGFEGTAGAIASKGIPLSQIATVITILIELGGGILLIVGWQARWAATAIFLFTIPATLLFHNFWAADAAQQAMQQTQFLKNLAIMGGMLYVMAYGAGPLSIDQRQR